MKPQPKAAAKAKKPVAKAKPAPRPAAKVAKPAAKPAKPAVAAKKPGVKAAAPAKKPAAKKAVAAKAPEPAKAPAAKAAAAQPAVKAQSAAASGTGSAAKAAPAPAPATIRSTQPAAAPTRRPAAPPARPQSLPQSAPPKPATVASNAAKASYIPMASPSVFTPPPAVAIKKDPKLANNWKTKTVEEMSDDEVLAMPDSEYMNEKQMAFFRRKLIQLKQDILNSAGETTEHLREDTVIVPDPADRATIEEEHALELRTRDRERKLLKKIEQSIGRIDAGDYGYCDETGEPIGVGRLLARPTATLSLEAQQRRELKQKMFGD
ncbi:MAG: RNA polymerase-binding protein DksA [Pseudomonadota bacterium]